MGSENIQFMTTLGCHLCEQAWSMIDYLQRANPDLAERLHFTSVEISESETLIEQYGISIPVLVSEKGKLCWPFDLDELNQWLIG